MSRLDELIQEYCPDGVEYKKVKDEYSRLKGTPITAGKMKEIEKADGKIRIFAGGKTVINADEIDIPKANITRVPALLVQSRGAIDFVYYDKPFTFKNEMWAYTHENLTSIRYLYHVLRNNLQYFRDVASGMGSLPQISLKVTEEFEIPVPPLPVQEEIVKILDTFSMITAELQVELQAELQARKKQYDYYADLLFTSKISRNEWLSVGSVIETLKTGLNPRQNFKLNVGGDKAYITGKDIYNNSINISEKTDMITDDVVSMINKRACLASNDVLFASTGTGTVGRMAVVVDYDSTWTVSETMYCLKPKEGIINPHYLMYALYTKSAKDQFESKITKGSVPHLKVSDLLNVKIPVINIREQKNLVGILRKLDMCCYDISSDLHAEIEARQKQYEYYRDKLLTFKQL